MYTPNVGANKKIKIRRFCIDDPFEREEYEKLATAFANKEVRFLKEPSEVFSQKEDKYYLVVTWSEDGQ